LLEPFSRTSQSAPPRKQRTSTSCIPWVHGYPDPIGRSGNGCITFCHLRVKFTIMPATLIMSIVAVNEADTEANSFMKVPPRSPPVCPMIAFRWRNYPRPARFSLSEGCESVAIEPRCRVHLHLFATTLLHFLPGINVFYRNSTPYLPF
jgi:hypothetical protein